MRVLLGFGVLLLITAVIVGPVAFDVLADPAPLAPFLVSFADSLYWLEWQPISLQITVAILLVVVLSLAWRAIRFGLSLLAKNMRRNS